MEFPLSGLPSWFDSALTSQFTSPASHPHPRDQAHLPFCKNYYKFRPKAACESSFSHLKSLILRPLARSGQKMSPSTPSFLLRSGKGEIYGSSWLLCAPELALVCAKNTYGWQGMQALPQLGK